MVALEAAGIPRRSLVMSLLGETLVLVVACVLGAAAGLVGVALALHSLPELATAPGGPILRYGLPVGAITIVLAVVLAAQPRRSGDGANGGGPPHDSTPAPGEPRMTAAFRSVASRGYQHRRVGR